jgi:hypothetical protein
VHWLEIARRMSSRNSHALCAMIRGRDAGIVWRLSVIQRHRYTAFQSMRTSPKISR